MVFCVWSSSSILLIKRRKLLLKRIVGSLWPPCAKMQSMINTVKGTALGVAGYLTPVLKVLFFVTFSIIYHYLQKVDTV